LLREAFAGAKNHFLMDEFIETTERKARETRVLSVPDSSPYKGSDLFFFNVRKRKEKRLKNKDAIFLFATQNIGNRYID